MKTDWYRWEGDDLVLQLKIQPRARQDAWAEPCGDCGKVQIQAPPVDGAANSALIRFLAKSFGVSRSAVTLLTGAGARHKALRIQAPRRLPEGIKSAGDATFTK